MRDFLFGIVGEDSENCGEQFFVECDTLEDAWLVVQDNFPDEEIEYICEYHPAVAEMIGLDTY